MKGPSLWAGPSFVPTAPSLLPEAPPAVNFTPKDQIILLAGLAEDARRASIWALPELKARLTKLSAAGLVDGAGLSDPAGLAAARRLRHITLDDLLAEHLPAAAPSTSAQ